jgi:Cdc6-like AAA superfamily ATPase
MPKSDKHGVVRLDYSDLKLRNYDGYFLADNPFPSIPVPEETPDWITDREKLLAAIEDITKEAFRSGKSSTLMVQGLPGNGKSHTLKYVKGAINAQLAKRAEDRGIAVYVENPGVDIKDFVVAIVEDLRIEFLRELAYTIIRKLIPDEQLLEFIEPRYRKRGAEILKNLGGDEHVLARLLSVESFRVLDLYLEVRKRFQPPAHFPDFLSAVLMLSYPAENRSVAAWNWLLGESLNKVELASMHVTQEIDDGDNALKAFADLRSLMEIGGYKMLYILLDEFENIDSLHAARKQKYFDYLRRWVDQNTRGFCLIACVTPAGWDDMREGGHPIVRRLLSNVDWLESFDAEQTEQLIAEYLRRSRERFFKSVSKAADTYQSTLSKHKSAREDLFPFSETAIKTVRDIAEGNIGDILTYSRRLLEKGADASFTCFDSAQKVKSFIGKG